MGVVILLKGSEDGDMGSGGDERSGAVFRHTLGERVKSRLRYHHSSATITPRPRE